MGEVFFVNTNSSFISFFGEFPIAIDKCTFYIGDVSNHG